MYIYTKWCSSCCKAKQIVVRSRRGGFVTKNCIECEKPRAVHLSELPDQCPKCGQYAKPIYIVNNYGYDCGSCGRFELAYVVPAWYEINMGWQGFGIPGVEFI